MPKNPVSLQPNYCNARCYVNDAPTAAWYCTQATVRHCIKALTMREKAYELGVTTSYNRPRFSNANPFAESLFRTCKYIKPTMNASKWSQPEEPELLSIRTS